MYILYWYPLFTGCWQYSGPYPTCVRGRDLEGATRALAAVDTHEMTGRNPRNSKSPCARQGSQPRTFLSHECPYSAPSCAVQAG